MKLGNLTRIDKEELSTKLSETKKFILDCDDILANKHTRDSILVEKITKLRDTYGDERRTKLLNIEDTSKQDNIPEDMEIETFVHGAMCISYSGRCLLSSFMTGRDSNKGACTHPCRWQYAVVEEKRPGEYMPIYENERGTYIFNSKDLCMIEHIPELILSGVDSLKIEGRMKTALYVATVARTYRMAIDDFFEGFKIFKDKTPLDHRFLPEKLVHRDEQIRQIAAYYRIT